jgi:catechol 2,3-dioxygenase
MIRTDRIGHVVIKVRELERSRKFYSEVLGLQVMKDLPQIPGTFLASKGRDHHEIALFEIGAQASAPGANQIGLSHIAFRLQNEEELRAAYQELKARGIEISFTVDHGVSKSVYFHDPDGHELEVYCDNQPEDYAHIPDPYLGAEKLDFAQSDPGLADYFAQLRQ